jgi:hypothetical protein
LWKTGTVELEKLDTAASTVVALEERFGNMERAIADLRMAVTKHPAKEFYLVEEFAEMVKRAPYTVREWCRLGRLRAKKGRYSGSHEPWRIPHDELVRYQNEGLLPEPRGPVDPGR